MAGGALMFKAAILHACQFAETVESYPLNYVTTGLPIIKLPFQLLDACQIAQGPILNGLAQEGQQLQ